MLHVAAQQALWLPNVGAEFTLGENKIPEPGPGEILVKLEASAINPIDWKIQKEGFFLVKKYPTIIGENGSGIVAKVGDEVTHFATGDRVTFASPFDSKYGGAYQQYCLADAELASKVPDNISFDEAAPITCCLSPFAVATYAEHPRGMGFTPPFETGGLGKYANQPIVIMGGACSVGQYGTVAFLSNDVHIDSLSCNAGIQLAKLSGFNPIITTASPKNKDLLHSLGATHVFDRKLPADALKDQVTNFVKAPIRYIFDAVSLRETKYAAYNLLAPGGTLALVAQNFFTEDEVRQKNILIVYGSFHILENRALGVEFATALTTWLAEGKIKPNPVQVLPGGLGGIVDCLKELETNCVSAKKFVVRPQETRA
ncbi:chaperonin 10-like protein [Boletus reticuloceps]|uniref:Chaperonin 10-like protein n=1 Tax=Boletus reticuloceps TaxID=495285 RepID=A0A8I2YVS4_9AGAM|nr:chaperonin 10-like protein [Boletus reticuloceps]